MPACGPCNTPTHKTPSQKTLIQRRYQYDRAGQLTQINDSRRGQLNYRYDPIGRLLEAQSLLGKETFAFDPAGNILDPQHQNSRHYSGQPSNAQPNNTQANNSQPSNTQPYTANPKPQDPFHSHLTGGHKLLDNLLKNYAGTHYTYDPRGNMIERRHNGVLTTFTWDAFNRLTEVETETEHIHYAYDPLGRRLHKTITPKRTLGMNPLYAYAMAQQRGENPEQVLKQYAPRTTHFGWDGDTLAWESTSDRTTHYIYGAEPFVPLMQASYAGAVQGMLPTPSWEGRDYCLADDPLWQDREDPPQAFDHIHYYQTDHLGTPQELVDEEGSLAWQAQYKAWGQAKEVISEAAKKAGIQNPLRFQGQYFDAETGLHYNRYRYYDPEAGRFVSKDPIGLFGGMNLYTFGPNTAEYVDPLGLSADKLRRSMTADGRPLKTGQTPHHVVQENCNKNRYVQNSREILERNGIGIDDSANGARLWGTNPSQTVQPNHPGSTNARAAGTYHAGPHVHSTDNDKLIYKTLKGVEKRGGNVENALRDIGQRMESGSWKATHQCCCP